MAGLNAAWVTANYPDILAAQEHVRQASQEQVQVPHLSFFTGEQAAEIEAMTAQIIPTDETPGAREARCVYFIDRALATFVSQQPAHLHCKGCRICRPRRRQLSLAMRQQVLGARLAAQQLQGAHCHREDAVLQGGPQAHDHRDVLCSARRMGAATTRLGWNVIGLRRLAELQTAVRLLRRREANRAARPEGEGEQCQWFSIRRPTEVDFVVIGSGAAGGIMAKELSVAGFSVVLLEQGGPGAVWSRAGITTRTSWLNMFPPSADERLLSDPQLQPNTFRPNEQRERPCPATRRRRLRARRRDRDLWCQQLASSAVRVPGSNARGHHRGDRARGLADKLRGSRADYYTKAEWELGVSGLRVDSPLFAPMSKPYPVPPLPPKASGALLKVAATKLGASRWYRTSPPF